jgi:hypothetical protein
MAKLVQVLLRPAAGARIFLDVTNLSRISSATYDLLSKVARGPANYFALETFGFCCELAPIAITAEVCNDGK